MEIAVLSPKTIKIKAKQTTFIVDPLALKGKHQADAVIGLTRDIVYETVEGARVTFDGPGEYEVGGIKVSAIGTREKTLFYFSIENMVLLLTKATSLKGKDIREADVVIILADDVSDAASLTAINASVVVLYGEKAQEVAAALGKVSESITKYTITKDKLPSEMEVVLLA